jgi:hypothetical protein
LMIHLLLVEASFSFDCCASTTLKKSSFQL